MADEIRWCRTGGYECSTRGDKRFSAFTARLADGRTIEQHYQCDVKGYDVGGTRWWLGKGRPPIRRADLWSEYLALWQQWAKRNPELIVELRTKALAKHGWLSDSFATTEINQARALAFILNQKENQ
jgi:hypothetical protein